MSWSMAMSRSFSWIRSLSLWRIVLSCSSTSSLSLAFRRVSSISGPRQGFLHFFDTLWEKSWGTVHFPELYEDYVILVRYSAHFDQESAAIRDSSWHVITDLGLGGFGLYPFNGAGNRSSFLVQLILESNQVLLMVAFQEVHQAVE